MVDFNKVKVETEDGVATLTLNHPEVMNAISLDMLEGLIEAFDFIEDKDNGVRCVVMTGAGKGFCAGANLQGRNTSGGKKASAGSVLESHYHPLLRRIRRLHCPIITAINGAAAGAGMSLSLMGDLKLAAKSAYFLQAFRRIGLVPDAGSTYILPRLVGTARAMELSLLGEKLPAPKALEWGLINRVHDDADLMGEAKKMATELAHGPTVSLALIRGLYWDSPENTFEEQLDLEFRTQRIAGSTADFKEGVTAFLEKRPAKFKGQ
jgi:2-(1,2-epoxy-1,2-dihydrophenyl)acetyl-CoA isomerase